MTAPAADATDTVRRPVWQGVQQAAGLWFTHAWPSEAGRIARLVATWSPGARALRFPEGDILVFAAPRPIDCEACEGLPLCRVNTGTIASAPLTAAERQRLDGADVGIVHAAHVMPLRLADGEAIDLARYVDIDAYALHDTVDCRDALPPPAHESLAGKAVRDVTQGKVPPPSKERDALLRALRDPRDGKAPGKSRGHGIGTALRTWLDALRGGLATAAPVAGDLPARQPPARHQRWRELLGHVAMFTRLSTLIGRQHAAHLARLLRLLDRGDVDEALRHAIPLGDDDVPSLGPAFGTLGRRAELTLSTRRSAGTHIGVGDDALRNHLRARYRRTFDKLDREGRIDEAVFVLAELLNARQEALDYLVKHDRAAQAADLALGWDMPPAAIIRLLMLAGDTRRAVLVARRDSAFSSAVAQLEGTHGNLAAILRREWGVALAAQGEWLLAVDAVWPLSDARELAVEWLLTAEKAGHELSARALVRRAQLLPDTLAKYAERIAALIDPDAPPAPREAMAHALADERNVNPTLRTLARLVLPMIGADRAAGANALPATQLTQIANLAGDMALEADLPKWRTTRATAGEKLYTRTNPSPIALPLPPPGLHAIADAVAIADNRWLVALGESGVAVVDAAGRMTQRYAVPADQLVIAQSRLVALAVATRGERRQVTRLDLARHRATDLGVMRLDHHAPDFDGLAWTVLREGRIQVLDTSTSACDVLWQVADLPGSVVAAAFDEQRETFLLRQGDAFESWRHEKPSRRLAARIAVEPAGKDEPDRSVLHPSGTLIRVRVAPDAHGDPTAIVEWQGTRRTRLGAKTSDEPTLATFHGFDAALMVGLHTGSGDNRYTLLRLADGARLAAIDWPGTAPRLRAQGDHFVWFDRSGRLLHLDTRTSRCHAVTLG